MDDESRAKDKEVPRQQRLPLNWELENAPEEAPEEAVAEEPLAVEEPEEAPEEAVAEEPLAVEEPEEAVAEEPLAVEEPEEAPEEAVAEEPLAVEEPEEAVAEEAPVKKALRILPQSDNLAPVRRSKKVKWAAPPPMPVDFSVAAAADPAPPGPNVTADPLDPIEFKAAASILASDAEVAEEPEAADAVPQEVEPPVAPAKLMSSQEMAPPVGLPAIPVEAASTDEADLDEAAPGDLESSDEPSPLPVDEEEQSVGQILTLAREELGLTIAQVAERSHIRVDYITALETDDRDKLPPAQVYIKSYIKSLCREYNLQAAPLVAQYQGDAVATPAIEPAAIEADDSLAETGSDNGMDARNMRKIAIAIAAAAMLLAVVVVAGMIRAGFARPDVDGPPAITVSEVESLIEPVELPMTALPVPHNPPPRGGTVADADAD